MYHHQPLHPAASVPKPWTGSSSAKRQWAPIRAPTPRQTLPTSLVAPAHNGAALSGAHTHTSPSMSKEPELQAGGGTASTAGIAVPVAGPTIQAGAHAPKMPESLEAALKHESSLSISGDKTSAAALNKSPENKSPEIKSPPENYLNSALDSLDDFLNDFPPAANSSEDSTNMSLSASKNQEDDDNNNKANTEALDDLTRQLMEALDTNEVVGWKESVDQIPTSTSSSSSGAPFGNCASCKSAIDGEASVVGSAHYHPKCFTCADCKAPLGTEKYYIIGGKNYCSKDRYKFLDNCTKCEKIIENETIRPKESGKPYHADCFCCTKCGVSLQGKYFNVSGDMLCEDCFSDSRETCSRCGRAIMEATLKALGQVYHPNCFVCSMCPQSLEGVEFFVTEDNKPMCKEDFARFMAKTCDGCEKKIIDESLIATNSGKHFHKDCYDNGQQN